MKIFKHSFLLLIFVACSGLKKSELLKGHQKSQHLAKSNYIMVASQGNYTSKAAQFIDSKGGNLFDIAVAMSFVISVERPHSTGIGGGGFLLSHQALSGETKAFDFREVAPLKSHSKMYLDKKGEQEVLLSRDGALAVAVPGLVQGVLEVHKRYGSLPLTTVLKPAIDLARTGFIIYPALGEAIEAKKDVLDKFESSKKIFFNKNGLPLKTGELLVQNDLASTLDLIANKGASGFYRGSVAKKIVNTIRKYGGIMSSKDLRGYQMKVREPLKGSFRGYDIISMPPPSSGGTHIIEILNILENFNLKAFGVQDPRTIHTVASAMQIAFADRAKYMGDSDFAKVPVTQLINKSYAKKLAKMIPENQAIPSSQFPVAEKNLYESDDTTHFTIMDKAGNVITSTQTINGWFGSGLVAEGTGIVLNNEMDDFASHVGGVNLFGAIGGKNNLVEPKKRPLSSMSPTIVFKNSVPVLALGTPSGTRILTCVMQTLFNRLEFDLDLYDSVHATRYHHQWYPEEIRIGPPYFSASTMRKLKKMGYKINKKSLGCKVQAIEKKGDELIGVSDNREEGLALGL